MKTTTEISTKRPAAKLLIVEDDNLSSMILERIFLNEPVSLLIAHTGEEAIRLATDQQPDLILLDVILPGMDGFEVASTLRKSVDNVPPIIFITAQREPNDIVKGFEAGGSDYITKPFQPLEVLARVRTHLRVRSLLNSQTKMIEQLTEANRSKNNFLGIAAHDLRSPLLSIRGLAELLNDDIYPTDKPEHLEMLQAILSGSDRMLHLINDLLDISRIEAGALTLLVKPGDPAAMLSRAVLINTGSARRKNISLKIAADDGESFPFDGERLQQVVENLLSNAIKFSPPGSTVEISAAVSDQHLTIRVRDQGPGIPENERHRLFQDFGRTSVQPTGGEPSTGLGLAICRKIVTAHEGTIDCRNLSGGGCEFSVSLPWRKDIIKENHAELRAHCG